MSDVEKKAAELRGLMRLTEESMIGAGLVLNALLEATLKQQEGTPLGTVEIGEQPLLDFLELLTEQTSVELRVRERAGEPATGSRPAEPLFQAFEEIVRDEKIMFDPERIGYCDSAIYADLARENTGSFAINVAPR